MSIESAGSSALVTAQITIPAASPSRKKLAAITNGPRQPNPSHKKTPVAPARAGQKDNAGRPATASDRPSTTCSKNAPVADNGTPRRIVKGIIAGKNIEGSMKIATRTRPVANVVIGDIPSIASHQASRRLRINQHTRVAKKHPAITRQSAALAGFDPIPEPPVNCLDSNIPAKDPPKSTAAANQEDTATTRRSDKQGLGGANAARRISVCLFDSSKDSPHSGQHAIPRKPAKE